MFKLKYVPEDDHLVAFERGSRRRAVAKAQVRDITALGKLAMVQHQGELCWLVCTVGMASHDSRAERYARYREVCRWFGIRY